MVKKSVRRQVILNPFDKHSVFDIHKTVVSSEESWLGLGLADENENEWFEIDVDSYKS